MEIPVVNSTILVQQGNSNLIGIVEAIKDNDIYVLLLDRNGRIKIKKSDSWTKLNISDLTSLRHCYQFFINKNISQMVKDNYDKFYQEYIKK